MVQLLSRELTDIWNPKPDGQKSETSKRYKKNSDLRNGTEGYGYKTRMKPERQTRSGRGSRPASRADHAVRILLGDMGGLDSLSAEDHAMLCELPAPHGPLFTWLEAQMLEHGAQSWVALREGLVGHESAELALRVMTDHEDVTQEEAGDAQRELRNLLNRILIEQLKDQETEAIQASKADPSALVRYREIRDRRLLLQAISDQPE